MRWEVYAKLSLSLSGVERSLKTRNRAVMALSRRNTVICLNKQTAAAFPRFNAFLVLSDKPLIPEIFHVFINSFSAAVRRHVAAYPGFSKCSSFWCGRGLNFSSTSRSTCDFLLINCKVIINKRQRFFCCCMFPLYSRPKLFSYFHLSPLNPSLLGTTACCGQDDSN